MGNLESLALGSSIWLLFIMIYGQRNPSDAHTHQAHQDHSQVDDTGGVLWLLEVQGTTSVLRTEPRVQCSIPSTK